MGRDHEGRRVSRRTIFTGISSIGLGSLLTACTGETPTTKPMTTSTGDSVTPRAQTTEDLSGLFADANTCALTPATTQGPYYFDADKIRSDIREDRDGMRLRLVLKVQDSESCKPIPNAVVEVWHCDADGRYSGAQAQSVGSGGGAPGGSSGSHGSGGGPPAGGGTQDLTPTDDRRYLRGAQVTNADGIVDFTTIWPGWYPGRTVHIHVMVHMSNQRVLTSQLMFDEELNAKVLAAAPYNTRGDRATFNSNDSIYSDAMLTTVKAANAGYLGVHVLSADSDRDGA